MLYMRDGRKNHGYPLGQDREGQLSFCMISVRLFEGEDDEDVDFEEKKQIEKGGKIGERQNKRKG